MKPTSPFGTSFILSACLFVAVAVLAISSATAQIVINDSQSANSGSNGNNGSYTAFTNYDAHLDSKLVLLISSANGNSGVSTLTAVTYNGVSLTKGVELDGPTGNIGISAIYYLDNPGAAGNIVVSANNKQNYFVSVLGLSGTASGIGATANVKTTLAPTTLGMNLTTTANNSLVVADFYSRTGAAPLATASSPLTQIGSGTTSTSFNAATGREFVTTSGTTVTPTFAKGGSTGTSELLTAAEFLPLTAPAAPTITGITPGNTSLSVAFTAGADGGSAITNYKYSTDNGSTFTPVSPAATTSPILISGLTNGTTYQVQILAVNAVGDGAASSTVSGTPAGGSVYASWAASYSLTGGNAAQTADPDGDGQNNLLEFATNDNPNSGSASGKQKAAVAAVGGQQVFTLTLPVRAGATFSGSFDLASATIDGIIYTIQGTIDLVAGFTNTVVPVSEVTGNDATTIQTGLPALETAWTYRTFRADGYTVSSNPYLFLRLKVTASP